MRTPALSTQHFNGCRSSACPQRHVFRVFGLSFAWAFVPMLALLALSEVVR